MARGKTFSITLPHVMVDEYDKQAKDLKVSRSKIVFSILLNAWNTNNPDRLLINCGYAIGLNCSKHNEDCSLPSNPEDCIHHIEVEE